MTFSQLCVRTLLCALGGLSSFGASGDVTNPLLDATRPHGDRVDRAWKRYRNAEFGYCVSYPSRWSRGDAFDGSGLFVETGLRRYSKPTGEIDIGPMNATPGDARMKPVSTTTDTLDQDLQDHLAGLQKFVRAEREEVIEQHRLKVQGLTALFAKHQYYDPLEHAHWMQEVVFLERNGELYRLELQCPPDQIKRFEPVFAYLVNTFELDCK